MSYIEALNNVLTAQKQNKMVLLTIDEGTFTVRAEDALECYYNLAPGEWFEARIK